MAVAGWLLAGVAAALASVGPARAQDSAGA
jgi:hypothetical protein